MKRSKDPTVYGIYFGSEATSRRQYQSHDIEYCRLRMVTVSPNGEIRNPSDVNDQSFYDLDIVASWNTEHHAWGVSWVVLYENLYYVDLSKLKHYQKELARVRNVQKRFPIGPTTFGQFVLLLAKGLGIQKFVVCTRSNGGFYSDGEHQIRPINDVQSFIDSKIDESRKPVAEVESQTA